MRLPPSMSEPCNRKITVQNGDRRWKRSSFRKAAGITAACSLWDGNRNEMRRLPLAVILQKLFFGIKMKSSTSLWRSSSFLSQWNPATAPPGEGAWFRASFDWLFGFFHRVRDLLFKWGDSAVFPGTRRPRENSYQYTYVRGKKYANLGICVAIFVANRINE